MKTDAILITGVAKRVGLHLAQTFLERGHPVIGTYRTDHSTLAGLAEAGADLYHCDFYDEASIDRLLISISDRYSSLRAIIHNASDWIPEGAMTSATEIMNKMMQVHVTAPYLLNLSLAPLLEACTGTHADIIHIGDYVSTRGSTKHVAYAASKAAQDNLTLSFSARLAPKVKVNSIAPALVMFNEGDDEAYKAKARNKSLMRREAGLEEFQLAIDYLLESVYVTGRTLHMDGGRHLRVA